MVINPNGPPIVCSICSTPLVNYGATLNGFNCCRRCAIDVLPALIADAIGQNELAQARAESIWSTASAAYWKRISGRKL